MAATLDIQRALSGFPVSAQLNPEPYAYESAFAVRSLILAQIGKKDPALNYDADKGPVKSPILLWGPYLWADGVKGREGDALVYKREDLGGDGTHPNPFGYLAMGRSINLTIRPSSVRGNGARLEWEAMPSRTCSVRFRPAPSRSRVSTTRSECS